MMDVREDAKRRGIEVMGTSTYKEKDHVEVWSSACKQWRPGTVQLVEGNAVAITYTLSSGKTSMMQLTQDHEHIRHVANGNKVMDPACADAEQQKISGGAVEVEEQP